MLAGVEMRLARGLSIAPKRTGRLGFALIRQKEKGDHTQCTNPRRFLFGNASPPA
jgi:hypothetical protein